MIATVGHIGLIIVVGLATMATWFCIFLKGNDLQTLTLAFWRLLLLACFLNLIALIWR